jgi:DNA-binding IclR family transcriptional regulator
MQPQKNLTPTIIRLTADDHKWLSEVAKKEGLSKASVVRHCISLRREGGCNG